jgi:hypothetical protein
MNKWQMDGNEAPRNWKGSFVDRNKRLQFSIHPRGRKLNPLSE